MPERSSRKRQRDLNRLASEIVKAATEGEREPELKLTPEQHAARLLGSKGGKKGGIARAAKLTPEQRREIARRAAQARWSGHP
jgi:hypothetical protein